MDAALDFSKGLSKRELVENKQRQYAIVRAVELIGEAAKNLSSSFVKAYPKVPWKEIIGTRDKLIHHYFGVDLDVIWKIVKEDIPILEKEIKEILRKER
ncbi:MAG: DUF86 domain-containing protein [Nanoarchaeota archaeon]|nr:DUF86 domain-containing protein [Nanoarchaeota archaeon]